MADRELQLCWYIWINTIKKAVAVERYFVILRMSELNKLKSESKMNANHGNSVCCTNIIASCWGSRKCLYRRWMNACLQYGTWVFSSLAQSYIDDMMVSTAIFLTCLHSLPRQNDCWITWLTFGTNGRSSDCEIGPARNFLGIILHYDEIPRTQLDNGGQRIATLLVYLNKYN